MFTGIVTNIGTIVDSKTLVKGDKQFTIKCPFALEAVKIGASISFSGICLTIVEKYRRDHNKNNESATVVVRQPPQSPLPSIEGGATGYYKIDVSLETLSKTIAKYWKRGDRVNLERAMAIGNTLDGHLMSGHVDCVGTVENYERQGESQRITFSVPHPYKKYIAPKGSIAIDGISLTVNTVCDNSFTVNIIPHTWENTTLKHTSTNAKVNIEVDMIARYIARYMDVAKSVT